MRIISSFRDYYDGCQKHGQDREVVYVRETKEIVINAEDKKFDQFYSSSKPKLRSLNGRVVRGTVLVGFAGKIYPGLSSYGLGFDRDPRREEPEKVFSSPCFFDEKTFHYHVFPRINRRYSCLLSTFDGRIPVSSMSLEQKRKRNLEIFREAISLDFSAFDYLFEEFPAFILNLCEQQVWGRALKIKGFGNPRLEPTEFYRALDPFSAFQNLHMFLSNKAKEEKPMPIISDEMRAQSKGFDKWSFRKQPKKPPRKPTKPKNK
jgi:hypothetical protein